MKKVKFDLFSFIIASLLAIIISPSQLDAQCGSPEYFAINPSMFHYLPGEDPPEGNWDIANWGDDQGLLLNGTQLSGENPPCTNSHRRWTDGSDNITTGYIDFGMQKNVSVVTIPVKWDPKGILTFSAGMPGQNTPFLTIDFDNLPNRPSYPDCGTFTFEFTPVNTQVITLERVDGFNDAYELLFGTTGVSISGRITNECDTPIPAVTVTANNDLGQSFSTTTDIDGKYLINGLPCDRIWVITPSRSETDLCGIDEQDVTLIGDHILEINNPLQSEYARIAADVSGNGIIATLDQSLITGYILGLTNGFPVNNWRFVDASFTFPIPSNPFEEQVNNLFPNTINLSFLNTNAINQDFIAIKMGDVNCSYDSSCDDSPEFQTNQETRRSSLSNTAILSRLSLSVFPNPLSDQTTLQFSQEMEGITSITIYDLNGKEMPTVSSRQFYPSGNHQIQLDLATLPNGSYICVVEQQGYREILKLTKVK